MEKQKGWKMDECAVYGLKFLDPNVEVPRSSQSYLYPASSPEADSSCGIPQHHTYIKQYGDYEEPDVEWPEKNKIILIATVEKGRFRMPESLQKEIEESAEFWDFPEESEESDE